MPQPKILLLIIDLIRDQELMDTDKETEFELDEDELKRYLDVVIKEVKMKGVNRDS